MTLASATRLPKRVAPGSWTVYARVLDEDVLAPLTDLSCHPREIYVGCPGQAESVVAEILLEVDHIDGLVNNASIGVMGALADVPPLGVEAGFAVNPAGVHRVTRAVLPAMRERGKRPYRHSRQRDRSVALARHGWLHRLEVHTVEGLMDVLRVETIPHCVDVVIVEPGVTHTGFLETAMTTIATRQKITYNYGNTYRMLSVWLPFLARTGNSPDEVAEAVHRAASTERPKTRHPVGWQFRLFSALSYLTGGARDRLWSVVGIVGRIIDN